MFKRTSFLCFHNGQIQNQRVVATKSGYWNSSWLGFLEVGIYAIMMRAESFGIRGLSDKPKVVELGSQAAAYIIVE